MKGDFSKDLKKEANSIKFARRSIVAQKDIKIGDQFSEKNLTTKRPGIYIAANNWDRIIKKKSKKNIKADTPIKIKDF